MAERRPLLDVLIADDERPALDELEHLLRADGRVGAIHRASTGRAALSALSQVRVDVAFLDIHMPGMTGLELARTLRSAETAPAVVFVTADEEHAVAAFDLEAADYLLKPLRATRLTRTIDRLIDARAGVVEPEPEEIVVVTVGASVRRLRRSEVRYVQAQGDYARLHTDSASYLLRTPLSELETSWRAAGFLRIHRSYLVAVGAVTGLRVDASPVVLVGDVALPVSRRLLPAVRTALARPGAAR